MPENSAEAFIFGLKRSIDEIWKTCGDHNALDTLTYAGKEYGLMQRGELEKILESLAGIKKHLDGLYKDCLDIPIEFRETD